MRAIRKTWRFVRRDLFLKIISIVLALLVWYGAGDKQPAEYTVNVPLEIKNVSDDLILLGEIPDVVQARIRGRGRFFKFRLTEFVAVIDASEAEPGLLLRPITINDVVVPNEIDAEVREVIVPRLLRVEVDKKARRRVAVEPVLAGTPPAGFTVVGMPGATPDAVDIVGPERVVAGLRSVRLEDLNVSRLRGPVALRRLVDLSTLPMVEATPAEVEVQVAIDRLADARFPRVPVKVALGGRRVRATVTPDAVAVRLSGPESVVSRLEPDSLTLTIDGAGIEPGTYDYRTDLVGENRLLLLPAGEPGGPPSEDSQSAHRTARLSLPPGVRVVEILPSHFSVLVERVGPRRAGGG